VAAPAEAISTPEAKDLADLSLEQLGNIRVTTVTRRQESLADAPASVYVITGEAIRRSGATSIPEALRLAPNLDVARADTNQYAISARGFNNVLANKLLVLIDGRAIYTPLFSGVFWEAQDVLLEDVDRIEVTSGPNATLWGANAVNGVIHIITKSAADTQGLLVSAGGGSLERGVAARYGGKLPSGGAYRVYAKLFDRDHSELADGTDVRDDSQRAQGGFRADWKGTANDFKLQGDVYAGDLDQVPAARRISGCNVIGRWGRTAADGSRLRIRFYYDRTHRDHPETFEETLDTFDLDLQHTLAAIGRHEIVWGGGARLAQDSVENSPGLAFVPADRDLSSQNVFAQDGIRLAESVDLILGARVETNVYTDAEFLPSARLAWRPGPDQIAWASASRAVRAPSRIDRDFFVPSSPPYLLAGGPDFESEVANVYEVGYRSQPHVAISYSASAYYHDYQGLRSLELTPDGPQFENGIDGRVRGLELWTMLRVRSFWRIDAGGTVQEEDLRPRPGSLAIGGTATLGNDPPHWWTLRSMFDPSPATEFDVVVRRYGTRPEPNVPAYTAVDANASWEPAPGVRISMQLQNLFAAEHAEWGAEGVRAEFGRSFFLKVLWTR
jgi:iron complex outermembrane receptor protein